MDLGELIKILEEYENQNKKVKIGFGKPLSYRGNYADIAFEPQRDITVAEMLENVKFALGKTLTGYKGGEFKMDKYTQCWVAKWGETGTGVGKVLLAYMLEEWNWI